MRQVLAINWDPFVQVVAVDPNTTLNNFGESVLPWRTALPMLMRQWSSNSLSSNIKLLQQINTFWANAKFIQSVDHRHCFQVECLLIIGEHDTKRNLELSAFFWQLSPQEYLIDCQMPASKPRSLSIFNSLERHFRNISVTVLWTWDSSLIIL